MTDLERLARAICVDDNRDPDAIHPPGLGVPQWQHHVRAARAVVAALREPSEAMLGNGGVAMTKTWTDPWDELGGDVVELLALPEAPDCQLWEAYKHVSPLTYATWQAMIDAALSDA